MKTVEICKFQRTISSDKQTVKSLPNEKCARMCLTSPAIYGIHSNDNNEVNAFSTLNYLHGWCCECIFGALVCPNVWHDGREYAIHACQTVIIHNNKIVYVLLSQLPLSQSPFKVTFTRNYCVRDKLRTFRYVPFWMVNYSDVNNKYAAIFPEIKPTKSR